MSTSKLLTRQPAGQVPAPQTAPTVHLLHSWGPDHDETELYASYEDALHALATATRRDWSKHEWHDILPGNPDGMDDATVVSHFYVHELVERPVTGEFRRMGFDITELPVHGSALEPTPRRSATLYVVDEHSEDQSGTLTYRIDALGLRIGVAAGADGPVVSLRNGALPPGTAVTVIATDFEESAA